MSNEIRIVKRSELDSNKWTKLVNHFECSVYNQVHYLDSLAEHWVAVVLGDYKGGMAIPYTIRLGVKGIYTPNFLRAVDWIGEQPTDFNVVELLLKEKFTRAHLNVNQPVFKHSDACVYQVLDQLEEMKLGSQSKRSIKKFEKTDLSIETIAIDEALPLIIAELKAKVKDLRTIDFLRFQNLLLNYPSDKCFCYGVKGDKLHAASILIEWKDQWLFIKGGVDAFGKENGCMHALMKDSILKAFENGKRFSFEGSTVDTVRQFNRGFGAKDQSYFSWNWNHSPWWFRILLTLRK